MYVPLAVDLHSSSGCIALYMVCYGDLTIINGTSDYPGIDTRQPDY